MKTKYSVDEEVYAISRDATSRSFNVIKTVVKEVSMYKEFCNNQITIMYKCGDNKLYKECDVKEDLKSVNEKMEMFYIRECARDDKY